MPTAGVLLLRHAETASPDVWHGAESDIGLSQTAHDDARAFDDQEAHSLLLDGQTWRLAPIRQFGYRFSIGLKQKYGRLAILE